MFWSLLVRVASCRALDLALDQPPQHLSEVWWLIEWMSAVDVRAFAVQGLDSLIRLRCGFPHLGDSFAGEEEVLRIDVTCLYEAAGLLGGKGLACLSLPSALALCSFRLVRQTAD